MATLPKVGRHPIAHYNGTLQWHHIHYSPKVGPHPPPNHNTLNGTLRWHPAVAPRPLHPAMAPWCHVQSAKVVRRPPPLLEVRTPIAIAIWGIKLINQKGTPNRSQPIKHGSEIQRRPVVELTSRCRGAQLLSSNPGHFDRPKNHLK